MINTASDVSEIGSTAVSLVASSNASGVLFAALHKLLSYIRFLNIEFSDNLESVLQAKKSESILIRYLPSMPQSILEELVAKPIHPIFLYRKVGPTFLGNFWKMSLFFGILITCSVSFTMMIKYFQNKNNLSIVCKACKILRLVMLKIFVMQFYLNFGDMVLYFVLEVRSLRLSTFNSALSFFTSLFFMVVGTCVCVFHFYTLKSLFKISKSERNPEKKKNSRPLRRSMKTSICSINNGKIPHCPT